MTFITDFNYTQIFEINLIKMDIWFLNNLID